MRRIFRKTKAAGIAIIAAAGMATTVFAAGCSTGIGVTSADVKAANDEYKSSTVTGKVTGISDDSISVEISEDTAQMPVDTETQNAMDSEASSQKDTAVKLNSEVTEQAEVAADSTTVETTTNEGTEAVSETTEAAKDTTGDGESKAVVFKLESDTTYKKASGNSQGQPPAMPGNNSSNSENTDTNSQGQPPAMPGNNSSNSENTNGNSQGQPPAKPDGDTNSENGAPQGQPPAMPGNNSSNSEDTDGNNQEKPSADSGNNATNVENTDGNGQGQPPAMPEQSSSNDTANYEDISLSDIKEGDRVEITLDDEGKVSSVVVKDDMPQGGMQQGGTPGGSGNSNISYTAVKSITEETTIENETIDSTGDEENAVLVDGNAKGTIKNTNLTRKSDTGSNGDNASFYGVGAAALAKEGSLYVKGGTIDTQANGAAGVFAYGNGTAYVADTKITTANGASGGIHAAGGGTLYAWDLDVDTKGQSSAAIRSDRGGGTMVIDGGNYTSNGNGSPAIYSTADIAVNNSTLTANGSEAICIEGKNSIRLYDCDLTGNMSDDSQNDHTWNVILYQSMSGDSEVGNSTFTMDGGTLTAKNGGMFYTTNTQSTFVIKDVDITYADDSEYFLRASGNNNSRGWGNSGSNGADCDFTAISQEMQGNVIWDSISELDFYMTQGSTLTGAVVKDDSFAGGGNGGYCSVYIDADSKWVVTENSTLTNLYNAGTIVDTSGKTVTVKGSDGSVYVEGDSEYVITVEKYAAEADTTGAGSIESFDTYKIEKPEELL